MQAVVAVAAVVLRIFLSEVMQEDASSAYRRLGVCRRLLQELLSDVLFRHGLALHKLLQFLKALPVS